MLPSGLNYDQGSLFIVYDTLRTRRKRAKLMNQVSDFFLNDSPPHNCTHCAFLNSWPVLLNPSPSQLQLLSTLSLFDVMGSCAYALTTLPTPEADEMYGARGNKQSCTAQGFFVQIGTIACFLNVSLALYYLLTIKYGWSEGKLKRNHAAYFLFIPPIAIGLVYAFVGIPYYDNVRVWCNNSAKQVLLFFFDLTFDEVSEYTKTCTSPFWFLFQMVAGDSSHSCNHCSNMHHGKFVLPRL